MPPSSRIDAHATATSAVRFDRLSFHRGFRAVLQNLDLTIPAGSLAAVVGRSGSGKTTLRRLMEGGLVPTSGSIEVLGRTPEEMGDEIGARVASVPQELILCGASILDAVVSGPAEPDIGRAVDLCERLGILDWGAELPSGILSPLDGAGTLLPAAARRQIALARALYMEPELLLLDEPTLWLDAAIEQKLHRILKERRRVGKTTIVFTHRLGGVMQCDFIALLENGSIVEQGAHLELMLRCGTYHGMWLDQLPIAALEELVGGPRGRR